MYIDNNLIKKKLKQSYIMGVVSKYVLIALEIIFLSAITKTMIIGKGTWLISPIAVYLILILFFVVCHTIQFYIYNTGVNKIAIEINFHNDSVDIITCRKTYTMRKIINITDSFYGDKIVIYCESIAHHKKRFYALKHIYLGLKQVDILDYKYLNSSIGGVKKNQIQS